MVKKKKVVVKKVSSVPNGFEAKRVIIVLVSVFILVVGIFGLWNFGLQKNLFGKAGGYDFGNMGEYDESDLDEIDLGDLDQSDIWGNEDFYADQDHDGQHDLAEPGIPKYCNSIIDMDANGKLDTCKNYDECMALCNKGLAEQSRECLPEWYYDGNQGINDVPYKGCASIFSVDDFWCMTKEIKKKITVDGKTVEKNVLAEDERIQNENWRYCSAKGPPIGLKVEGNTNPDATEVTLSWIAPKFVESYQIRANDGDVIFNANGNNQHAGSDCAKGTHYLCKNEEITTTSFKMKVIPGHTYTWWVHSVYYKEISIPSSSVTFTVSDVCKVDSDCGLNEECKSKKCVKIVTVELQSCTSNTNCKSGEKCINKQCVVGGCTSNADCKSGEECNSGKCEKIIVCTGKKCDGSSVTGTSGDVVCGLTLYNYLCTANGYEQQISSCDCKGNSAEGVPCSKDNDCALKSCDLSMKKCGVAGKSTDGCTPACGVGEECMGGKCEKKAVTGGGGTKGDVNCDGVVDDLDANAILDNYFGDVPLPVCSNGKNIVDVNCDGVVDNLDANAILDNYFGDVPLPVC